MAGKRKDLSRRNLPTGVSQKKDGIYKGRYCYTYQGLDGKRHSVYSYRLYETDPVPKGKKADSCIPLMTTIAQIVRDKEDGFNSTTGNITFNEMFQKYMELKPGIKDSTRNNILSKWNLYIRDGLGEKKIAKITYIDIKSLYLYLLWDWPNRLTGKKGLSMGTVLYVHGIVYSVLELARKNKFIRENPSDGIMADIRAENQSKVQINDHIKSLTVVQQKNFLAYVESSEVFSKWYNLFIVLFGTGMRIGEACALRREDLDFEHNIINVNFSVHYYKGSEEDRCRFHMSTPKTAAGKRTIPMFPEVRKALLRQMELQLGTAYNTVVVDGYSGFVFLNQSGNLNQYSSIDQVLRRIVSRYNKEEVKQAEKEKRDPELLPFFSVHDIRHTFATRMAENGANQLVLKKVMGHESITTTLDVYAEVTDLEEHECFDGLEGKMSLS